MNQQAHLLNGRGQAACIVVGTKARLHGAIDDAGRHDVGDGTFELAGHLDAHAPVVLGNDDERAVADVLAAQLPAAGNTPGVGGNVFRGGGGHHQNNDLRTGVVLQLFELCSERLYIVAAERAALVNDPASQLGHGLRLAKGLGLGPGRWRKNQQHTNPYKNNSC